MRENQRQQSAEFDPLEPGFKLGMAEWKLREFIDDLIGAYGREGAKIRINEIIEDRIGRHV